jgi:hypothetical protein
MSKLIDSITHLESNKRNIRKDTYKYILQCVKDRILLYARANKKICIYIIPTWIPGKPLYDRQRATDYVRRKLIEEGMEVAVKQEFQVCVSWFIDTTRKKKKMHLKNEDPKEDPFDQLDSLVNKMSLR